MDQILRPIPRSDQRSAQVSVLRCDPGTPVPGIRVGYQLRLLLLLMGIRRTGSERPIMWSSWLLRRMPLSVLRRMLLIMRMHHHILSIEVGGVLAPPENTEKCSGGLR
jgi:hypothetical protein